MKEHLESLLKKFYSLSGLLGLHGACSLSIKFLDLDQFGYALFKRDVLAAARTTHILRQVLGELEQINAVG